MEIIIGSVIVLLIIILILSAMGGAYGIYGEVSGDSAREEYYKRRTDSTEWHE